MPAVAERVQPLVRRGAVQCCSAWRWEVGDEHAAADAVLGGVNKSRMVGFQMRRKGMKMM